MGNLGAFLMELPMPGRIRRRDLIEKDFLTHRILQYLSVESPLKGDLAFKGGTCLTKAHLGYFRFSEDIDFTWNHQDEWLGLPAAQVKKRCSSMIGEIAEEMEVMSADLELKFLGDKAEPDQVGIGSSGRMVTFFLWYNSSITDQEEFLKVQLNFVDDIYDPISDMELSTFIDTLPSPKIRDGLIDRYPEEMEAYMENVRFPCYSAREIYLEKCRAILTRKGVKDRDLIDVALLESTFDFTVKDQAADIIKKTIPMMKYRRYETNLRRRQSSISTRIPEHEESMLIIPIPPSIKDRLPCIYEDLYSLKDEIIGNP